MIQRGKYLSEKKIRYNTNTRYINCKLYSVVKNNQTTLLISKTYPKLSKLNNTIHLQATEKSNLNRRYLQLVSSRIWRGTQEAQKQITKPQEAQKVDKLWSSYSTFRNFPCYVIFEKNIFMEVTVNFSINISWRLMVYQRLKAGYYWVLLAVSLVLVLPLVSMDD